MKDSWERLAGDALILAESGARIIGAHSPFGRMEEAHRMVESSVQALKRRKAVLEMHDVFDSVREVFDRD